MSGLGVFPYSVKGVLPRVEDIDEALEGNDSNDVRSERIDIFKVVDELRGKRMRMVDTFEAYDFIYKAVAHYGQNKSKYAGLLRFDSNESDFEARKWFERKYGKFNEKIDVDQISEEYVLPSNWSLVFKLLKHLFHKAVFINS